MLARSEIKWPTSPDQTCVAEMASTSGSRFLLNPRSKNLKKK
jgi:hypothetical protein